MKTLIKKSVSIAMLALAFMLLTLNASAQSAGNNNTNNKQDKKEMIQAQKVAFITREVNFSTTEAEKFWPLYNEYQAKKLDINKPKREMEKTLKQLSPDQITDRQAEDLLNLQLSTEQSLLDLKKEYIGKYKAVIGIKKTAQFFQAEKKFNDFLLRQLKDAKQAPKP